MHGNPRDVKTGIDVLRQERFARLAGLRVGLITNHTGLDHDGRSTVDLLREADGVRLVKLFSPEHGLFGNVDQKVDSFIDVRTQLTVNSLYGQYRRPTPEMLEGIDILVFDIQDIGARFYTYISTMAYAMEEAGKAGIRFLVLDRPNPVTGKFVEGPVLDSSHLSFTGYFPLPVRHGMTVGELAQLFNGENHLNVGLEVVKVEGWQRDQWFDDTGIPWVNPSPNIRCLRQAILYTAAGLVESTNVSVGRGTESPFEIVGAPWVSAPRLTSLLKKRKLPGVSFTPAHFTPTSDRYRGQLCHGVQLNLTDRSQFRSVECGLEIARALALLYPRRFNTDKLVNMIGSEAVTRGIRQGTPVQELLRLDRPKLSSFLKTREKYLIYK